MPASKTQKEKLEDIAFQGFLTNELKGIPKQVRMIVNALHNKDYANAVIASEYLSELTARLYERLRRAEAREIQALVKGKIQ